MRTNAKSRGGCVVGRVESVGDGNHYAFRGSTFHGPAIGRAEHGLGQAFTTMSALPATPTAFTGREQHVKALLDVLDPGTASRRPPGGMPPGSGTGVDGRLLRPLNNPVRRPHARVSLRP